MTAYLASYIMFNINNNVNTFCFLRVFGQTTIKRGSIFVYLVTDTKMSIMSIVSILARFTVEVNSAKNRTNIFFTN
jgi:hypothetical protein